MTPLRKLRQDCTVPTIFHKKNRNETNVKKVLTPDELLKHMVNNNEINCKERLRMIASCLNGKRMGTQESITPTVFNESFRHRPSSIAHH